MKIQTSHTRRRAWFFPRLILALTAFGLNGPVAYAKPVSFSTSNCTVTVYADDDSVFGDGTYTISGNGPATIVDANGKELIIYRLHQIGGYLAAPYRFLNAHTAKQAYRHYHCLG